MIRPERITTAARAIVESVSKQLTPKLQALDGAITGVHYQQGHPLEINNRLVTMDKSNVEKFRRLPCVMFVEDYNVAFGSINGGVGTFRWVIACHTSPEYSSEQRDEKTFRPILYPIYEALMKAIELSPVFAEPTLERIQHTMTPRKYWGRVQVEMNDKNKFYTHIDAIDLTGMRLTIKLPNC